MEAINEIEYWYSEYELRQFIDIAKRYKINNKYSGIFESYVKNGRTNYEKFSKQLRDKLTTINNWEAIGLDLNSRFLVGFENYFIWYNENITEIKGMFDETKQICPYTIMLEIMKSTKKEILKYFPNIEIQHQSNLTNLEQLPPKPKNSGIDEVKYTAKHYLLAYLFDCNARGEGYPLGNKKVLERIGNERVGVGKGNRFYKLFNEITSQYDINIETNLIEIGGDNWRKAVVELSKNPELVKIYLQSKQL